MVSRSIVVQQLSEKVRANDIAVVSSAHKIVGNKSEHIVWRSSLVCIPVEGTATWQHTHMAAYVLSSSGERGGDLFHLLSNL